MERDLATTGGIRRNSSRRAWFPLSWGMVKAPVTDDGLILPHSQVPAWHRESGESLHRAVGSWSPDPWCRIDESSYHCRREGCLTRRRRMGSTEETSRRPRVTVKSTQSLPMGEISTRLRSTTEKRQDPTTHERSRPRSGSRPAGGPTIPSWDGDPLFSSSRSSTARRMCKEDDEWGWNLSEILPFTRRNKQLQRRNESSAPLGAGFAVIGRAVADQLGDPFRSGAEIADRGQKRRATRRCWVANRLLEKERKKKKWWVGMDVTRTGGCIHHGSWLCNQKDAAPPRLRSGVGSGVGPGIQPPCYSPTSHEGRSLADRP